MTPDAVELTGDLDPGQTSIRLERALVELPAGRVAVTVRPLPAGQAPPAPAAGLVGATVAETLCNIHAFLDANGYRADAAAIDARAAEARAGWEEHERRLEEARATGGSIPPE
jgi:hypothetical protein